MRSLPVLRAGRNRCLFVTSATSLTGNSLTSIHIEREEYSLWQQNESAFRMAQSHSPSPSIGRVVTMCFVYNVEAILPNSAHRRPETCCNGSMSIETHSVTRL